MEPETWREFLAQDPVAEWGQYLMVSDTTKADMTRVALGKMFDAVGRGAWRRGYQPRPESFKILGSVFGTTDVLSSGWRNVGIRGYGDLAPEPRAFIVWAEAVVEEYRRQADTFASLVTWRGFLAYQLARVARWWHPDDPADD